MKSAIMVGYPGSIAALRQQAGRAGRKVDSSLAVMIASPEQLTSTWRTIPIPQSISGKRIN